MKDKVFTFTEHDTFIFGRMDDCHCCLPDDIQVSRHHFFLEMNPPDARIRDLGSMNGTWVNGEKIGACEQGETPEEGLKRQYQEVALKDGEAWASIYLQAGQGVNMRRHCRRVYGGIRLSRERRVLIADWSLAARKEPLFKIEPLR